MPIELYTGGAEHAVMHLLYFRFFTKALRDLGLLGFGEPTLKLRNQGQILGADHNRMSKSRGNVQAPDELVARYGADTVRAFLMFIGPWDQGGPWNPSGIEGIHRWLARVWGAALPVEGATASIGAPKAPSWSGRCGGRRTPTIAAVDEDYAEFHFNTAIAKLMELTNAIIRAREAGLSGSRPTPMRSTPSSCCWRRWRPTSPRSCGSGAGIRTASTSSRGRRPMRRWPRPTRSSCRCRSTASCATAWSSRPTRRPRRSSAWRSPPSTSSATWPAARRCRSSRSPGAS